MCRLFGFRSVFEGRAHHGLIHAENALQSQGQNHPDGWGVAYYHFDIPHIIKSEKTVFDNHIFDRVSGVVESKTVVAHIRKATQGQINLLNTHPFQYGKWVFAHNGHIHQFEKYREEIKKLIDPSFLTFNLGTTDSECLFYYLLQELSQHIDINDQNCHYPLNDLAEIIQHALEKLCKIIGPISKEDCEDLERNYLTFILTDGPHFLAFQGGKKLHYSTHKKSCGEKDTCSFYSANCENSFDPNLPLTHLIVSSEPVSNDNVWNLLSPYEFIAIDATMNLKRRVLVP